MTQTSTATQITAQIAAARETMQHLSPASPLRELQERRINKLKAKLQACRLA